MLQASNVLSQCGRAMQQTEICEQSFTRCLCTKWHPNPLPSPEGLKTAGNIWVRCSSKEKNIVKDRNPVTDKSAGKENLSKTKRLDERLRYCLVTIEWHFNERLKTSCVVWDGSSECWWTFHWGIIHQKDPNSSISQFSAALMPKDVQLKAAAVQVRCFYQTS